MKSILLTSTALIAFAGAAAAESHENTSGLIFTGDATLGYNDTTDVNENDPDRSEGFYWDASLDVSMSTALDNGLIAAGTFSLSVAENDLGDTVTASDYILSLTSPIASLQFGLADPVAESRFNGVDGSDIGFFDQDAHLDSPADGGLGFDAILVGETTVAGYTAAVSFGVDGGDADISPGVDEVDAAQVYLAGSVSILDLELAYQDEVAAFDEIFGAVASATVANANLAVSYLDQGDENSIGLSADYPIGPIVVGGYYSINDIAEDNYGLELIYATDAINVTASYDVDGDGDNGDDAATYGVEGSYDVGNGLIVYAGYIGSDVEEDIYYAAAEYDLGGGAEILVSYADDGDDTANLTDDAIGDPEYQEGATIEVTFEF